MSLKQSAFYTDLGEMMKNPESVSLFVTEVQKLERKRIIKLLEAEKEITEQSLDYDTEFYAGLDLAIVLIKGETK